MTALDLRYRPRKFSEVFGNATVVKLLLTRSKEGTLGGRSMMFGGPKGCGKTSLARIAARAIVCDNLADGEPCGECDSCNSISDESSDSFDEFDAATQGTVDRMRGLIGDLDYHSINGKPRIVLLDEAHRLTKQAQDSLLKSIEDRRLVAILCTTEPRKMVEAIRTRVEEYPVSPPTEMAIESLLYSIAKKEKIKFEDEAFKMIAKATGNCPRECVCALDTLRTLGGATIENTKQFYRFDRMRTVVDVLSFIDQDAPAAFNLLDQVRDEGATWIRDTMVAAISAAIRHNIGVKSSFPLDVTFFPIREMGWADLASRLGSIDKVTIPDIEACLLTSPLSQSHQVINVPTPRVQPPLPPQTPTTPNPITTPSTTDVKPTEAPKPPAPPIPTPAPKVEVKAPPTEPKQAKIAGDFANTIKSPKFAEVDGVRFTPDEILSSIDSKIVSASKPQAVEPVKTVTGVQFDKRNVPQSEKEFASGLLKRIKGP